MKFIIPVLPIPRDSSGDSYPANRLDNGFTPIIGPIDDDKIDETISSLKKERGGSSVKYIVLTGELHRK